MDLTKCNECGHVVSTDARKCPNCGYILYPGPQKLGGALLIILGIITLPAFGIGIFFIIVGIAVLNSRKFADFILNSRD